MAAPRTPPPVAASERLRIAIIGGLTRATHEWERAGTELGVILEHHDGRAHGCRADSLAAMVRRADVVVTITIPNSHNAVAIARKTAHQHNRPYLQVKRLRPSGLASMLADVRALARTAELAR